MANITGMGKAGYPLIRIIKDIKVGKIKIFLLDENLRKSFVEDGYKKVIKEFNLRIETNKLLQVLNKALFSYKFINQA